VIVQSRACDTFLISPFFCCFNQSVVLGRHSSLWCWTPLVGFRSCAFLFNVSNSLKRVAQDLLLFMSNLFLFVLSPDIQHLWFPRRFMSPTLCHKELPRDELSRSLRRAARCVRLLCRARNFHLWSGVDTIHLQCRGWPIDNQILHELQF